MALEIQPLPYPLFILNIILFCISILGTIAEIALAILIVKILITQYRQGRERDVQDESLPSVLRMWRFCKSFLLRFMLLPLLGTS